MIKVKITTDINPQGGAVAVTKEIRVFGVLVFWKRFYSDINIDISIPKV
jgi:hypothetical protein